MKILADASIPGLIDYFPAPFALSTYTGLEELSEKLPGQDILLCRSTLKVNSTLLKNNSLSYLATASSGTDHIDKACLKNHGIQLIDAKGSNAHSVADYVMASLAYLKQNNKLQGRDAVVVGLGMVGSQVRDRLLKSGFQVAGYDPLKALNEPDFSSCSLDRLSQADLICIHAELHDTAPHASRNLVNAALIKQLKEGVIIINASRGEIVNETALLANQQSILYCTDVYANEPKIDRAIVNYATLCTPHIAGHSVEAKIEAVRMISEHLHRCYQLPMPAIVLPKKTMGLPPALVANQEDKLLALYNPDIETQRLKTALHLEDEFIRLRKAHTFRHDFNV